MIASDNVSDDTPGPGFRRWVKLKLKLLKLECKLNQIRCLVATTTGTV